MSTAPAPLAKPPLQSACLSLFGNPSHPGWGADHLEYVDVPWEMWMDKIHITHVKINKIAAPSLRAILAEIWEACGRDQRKIKALGLDVFSGDWVVRQARGLKITSMHAYALAIDINAPRNVLGKGEKDTLFKAASLVVKIFEKHGWVWGGRWRGRRDAMHFQFAIVG